MTTVPATNVLPTEELDRVEHEAGVEFVNGRIVEKPVSIESGRIVSTIDRLLGTAAAQQNDVWIFSQCVAYRCFSDDPTKVRKPDLSAVRRERMTGIDQRIGFMPIPADLAVEVLSPTDLVYDVGDKVEEYLQAGFGLVWVVDPNTRTVAVHRPDGPPALLRENDQIDCGPLLPAFRHKVSEFFAG